MLALPWSMRWKPQTWISSLDHVHHVCTSFVFTSVLMLIINTSQNGNRIGLRLNEASSIATFDLSTISPSVFHAYCPYSVKMEGELRNWIVHMCAAGQEHSIPYMWKLMWMIGNRRQWAITLSHFVVFTCCTRIPCSLKKSLISTSRWKNGCGNALISRLITDCTFLILGDMSAETDAVVDTSSTSMPPHLKCHERPPLLVNPEVSLTDIGLV